MYLAARLLLCIVFALTLGVYYYAAGTVVLIAIAMLVAIIQPYKPEFAVYNAVDSVLILTLAMWYGTVLCINIAAVKLNQILRPTPSTPPVFDHLQYYCTIKNWRCIRPGNEATPLPMAWKYRLLLSAFGIWNQLYQQQAAIRTHIQLKPYHAAIW